ncbi:unnamed protein product [Clonostachys chloroleuca]|uniref:Sulfatase N-terminal domain-containing protein n=1 Tax=Clonostachys chloroleuca TaxID=1926264 RepID=A0AA35Q0U7_9HYPO|nr:unnamed protein product [Clonostachys chloroleuca]
MLLNPRFYARWLVHALGPRIANRRFAFVFTVLAVLGAKAVHIIARHDALSTNQIGLWMYSFLAQDFAVLILIRLLLDNSIAAVSSAALRTALSYLGNALLVYNLVLGFAATTFFAVTGSEIHWHHAALASVSSSRAFLPTGIFIFCGITVVMIALSWLLQDFLYGMFGFYANVVRACCSFVSRLLSRCVPCCRPMPYTKVPSQDIEHNHRPSEDYTDSNSGTEDLINSGSSSEILTQPPIVFRLLSRGLDSVKISISSASLYSAFNFIMHFLATASLLVFIGFRLARPDDGSLTFIAWTTGLLPFVSYKSLSPSLENLRPIYGVGIQHEWDRVTALTEPIPMPWLPRKETEGFEDWYRNVVHYNASADPMKIDNLDEPLLPELKSKLKDLDIRHVVLFFMESVRNDVFPIKKDGLVWNRLAETWPENKLPQNVQDRLARLTPTANFITGDYDDGFNHKEPHRKRGGAHFTNYYTAGTYTLKSLPATICGMGPLIGDFNLDWKHHMYQPCLPHIFQALNNISTTRTQSGPYAKSKWQSYFYQTATLQFNQFDKLMRKIGFLEENTIDVEYLRSSKAKYGPVTIPYTNYFGFEEEPLIDYIHDAFASAKEKDERVFLTHITSTTHHPFVLPLNAKDKYLPLSNGLDELSHYINTQGYSDQWIQKFFNILDKQGVSNQTLVIFVGDHGTSLAENDIASSYYNPNIGNDHVPLVISHPQLPAFNVDSAVSGIQVLPTILDFLLETGSLNEASREAIKGLVRNYEGQSLIRPQKVVNKETGQGNWQFTTVNPGRAQLVARDARHPERRLIIPVLNSVKWRFSNVIEDPREENSVQASGFAAFLKGVEKKHGIEVAKWAEEGAFVARYFAAENAKRWHYGPYAT